MLPLTGSTFFIYNVSTPERSKCVRNLNTARRFWVSYQSEDALASLPLKEVCMRIKLIPTKQGYRLEGYSENRNERSPLATIHYQDVPTLVAPDVHKSRMLDMMTRTGLAYAERHGARRYTSISEVN